MPEKTGPSKGSVPLGPRDHHVWIAGGGDAEGVALIYSTFPTLEAARVMAHRLIEREIAACVNIIPGMVAIYVWEGKVQEDGEVSVLIKTRSSLTGACIAAVLEEHPYTTPAVLAFSVSAGSGPYVDWIMASTVPPRGV